MRDTMVQSVADLVDFQKAGELITADKSELDA
jgi:hypothetical protein